VTAAGSSRVARAWTFVAPPGTRPRSSFSRRRTSRSTRWSARPWCPEELSRTSWEDAIEHGYLEPHRTPATPWKDFARGGSGRAAVRMLRSGFRSGPRSVLNHGDAYSSTRSSGLGSVVLEELRPCGGRRFGACAGAVLAHQLEQPTPHSYYGCGPGSSAPKKSGLRGDFRRPTIDSADETQKSS
jgi:hypothetical protein